MDDVIFGILLGCLLGILLGFVVAPLLIGFTKDVEQLGQAICEEEYGMDYESYIGKTLKCQPMKENYDGIRVEVYTIPN